jgi:uncharacterized protein YciU (UPF0263 family)
LQRFINRDEPLLRDGPNPYPYVHNSPTNANDPSGQYTIQFNKGFWRGDPWTAAQKAAINGSLARIKNRVNQLIAEINKEMKSLSPCMRGQLAPEVNPLLDVLTKMSKDFLGGKDIELYHYDFKDHGEVRAKTWESTWTTDAEIDFNDSNAFSPTWDKLPNSELDELLFHELSHVYSTEDDDSAGTLMNAHTIDNMINGSFLTNPTYVYLKNKAREHCAKC